MRPSPASHARTSDGTAPESEGSTRLPSFGDFSWGDAQCLPDSSKQIVQANPFAGVCSCLGATPADEADAPAEEATADGTSTGGFASSDASFASAPPTAGPRTVSQHNRSTHISSTFIARPPA